MISRHSHNLLLAFAAVGVLLSLYGLKLHYAPGGSSCDINAVFNCDIVNKGPYAEILGFPVAGIGLIGYLLLGIVSVFHRKERDPFLAKVLLGLSAAGFAFSLYLTGLEAFVIHAYCLICLGSLSTMLGIAAASLLILKKFHPAETPPEKSPTGTPNPS